MNEIKIFAPKFKTNTVLVATWKVKPGMNRIRFTKTWLDKILLMEADRLMTYPIVGNGSLNPVTRKPNTFYNVPVDDFAKADTGQIALFA